MRKKGMIRIGTQFDIDVDEPFQSWGISWSLPWSPESSLIPLFFCIVVGVDLLSLPSFISVWHLWNSIESPSYTNNLFIWTRGFFFARNDLCDNKIDNWNNIQNNIKRSFQQQADFFTNTTLNLSEFWSEFSQDFLQNNVRVSFRAL